MFFLDQHRVELCKVKIVPSSSTLSQLWDFASLRTSQRRLEGPGRNTFSSYLPEDCAGATAAVGVEFLAFTLGRLPACPPPVSLLRYIRR